jgi:urease gamma subunit
MKSSLAWDANERVEAYRKSVSSVHENVLLFKGFLGPSLRDNPNISSVGSRAARAAGVIVDELGKLRCPPGTPNANQFTDMQMSNCMVPGLALAKRAVRASRREVGQLLSQAKAVLDKKEVRGAARVAVMASLATLDALDYLNVDGSGTLSAMTLLGVDLVRSAGRDVAELALNRLEKSGKLTAEQRSDANELIDRLNLFGTARYSTGVLASIRKKNRKENRRLETPQMDLADASPPADSDRSPLLAKVTFDADSFNTELEAKSEKLLAKYVPDRGERSFEEFGDELMLKMGIPQSRSAKEMIDDSLDYLEKDGPKRIALITEAIDGLEPQRDARRKELAGQLQKIIDIMQTEEGKNAVRNEVAKGIIESLVGVEISLADNPSLRGTFTFEVHRSSDRGLDGAGGYAWMAAHSDGKVIPAVRIVPDSLVMDNSKLSDDVGRAGDMLDHTVRIIGADDNQVNLAIHEVAHASHYVEILRSVGIDPDASAKPALQQIISKGENVGDTYLGSRFALDHGIDPDAKWSDITKLFTDEKERRVNFGYTGAKNLDEYFGNYTTRTLHSFAVDSDSNALQNLNQFYSPKETVLRDKDNILYQALDSVGSNRNKMFGYKTDDVEDFKEIDGIRRVIETALDGQSIEDFMEEGRQAFSGVLGFDSMRIQSKGQTFRDVLPNLGQSSDYARTNIWESVAEGITISKYVQHFPDANVIDDKVIDDISRMTRLIVPQNSQVSSTIMTPEAKAWVRKLRAVSGRMPDLPKEEVIF